MLVNQFIQYYQLKPGDVLKVKKIVGFLDHYVVYLGFSGYKHIFLANMIGRGVVSLNEAEIAHFSQKYRPTSIRRFKGSQWERHNAVVRAVKSMKKQAYHLLTNNCEHFANDVQYGQPTSKQAGKFGVGLGVTGAIMALKSKNEVVQALGVLAMLTGAAVTISEYEKRTK